MQQAGPIPFEGLDLACGYPLGSVSDVNTAEGRGSPSGARQVLESIVERQLRRPPCIVAFSGGRDSSAILAVAIHVARKLGLPTPLPVTRRFADAARADEHEWQELVIRHLAITEWVIESVEDEMDIVGPLSQQRLLRHGVLWPPLLYGDEYFLRHAAGGSVLDGEGGDNVLGPESHRLAPIARAVRSARGRRDPRPHLSAAAAALAPAPIRRRRAQSRVEQLPLPWLRPAAQEGLAAAYGDHLAAQPLPIRRSLRSIPLARSVAVASINRRYLASLRDVEYISPFLEPSFIHALAGETPVLGPRHRAETLERLFSDLLPSAVLRRRTKAEFSQAVWRRHAREFAERWNGGGVDPELVDPDVLRALWHGPESNSLSSGLIQAAWLSDEGHRQAMANRDAPSSP